MGEENQPVAISKLLRAVLILSLLPVATYAVAVATHGNHEPASIGLGTFSLVAEGHATAIGITADKGNGGESGPTSRSMPVILPITDEIEIQPSVDLSASISISAAVIQEDSSAVITYDVTGNHLTMDGTLYEIVNGTGIFNQQSLVVVLHATVTTGDWTGTLVLIGHADEALSDPDSVGVTFDSPQSKLASKFFLDLSGTLTLS